MLSSRGTVNHYSRSGACLRGWKDRQPSASRVTNPAPRGGRFRVDGGAVPHRIGDKGPLLPDFFYEVTRELDRLARTRIQIRINLENFL